MTKIKLVQTPDFQPDFRGNVVAKAKVPYKADLGQ